MPDSARPAAWEAAGGSAWSGGRLVATAAPRPVLREGAMRGAEI